MRLLTDDVKIQRLALFSAIEAGNSFWARQVAEFGIAMVYEHLALGLYDATKFGAIS
jgi:DNA processing protein